MDMTMGMTRKQWEGKTVNGKFRLLEYLGDSDHSSVFRTEHELGEQRKAAIKLAVEIPQCSEFQFNVWKQAATLQHPHLLSIFEAGRCQIDSEPLTYVVMEYADENLSEITSQRRLSMSEAQELLPPVLSGLAHLHDKHFVHGNLKPSNILAVGDQVKLSCDTIRPIGTAAKGDECLHPSAPYAAPEIASGPVSSAADVWSLGVILEEASAPSGSAETEQTRSPQERVFFEIARGCLAPDPRQRWTIAEIMARLNSPSNSPERSGSVADARKASSSAGSFAQSPAIPWKPIFIVLACLVVLFLGFWLFRTRTPTAAPVAVRSPEPAPLPGQANPSQEHSASTPPKAAPESPSKPELNRTEMPQKAQGGVVERVLPNVPRSARSTIQGHLRVGIKVGVDASGNVVDATLESPGPSQYFARLALGAARNWKFAPAPVNGKSGPSQWNLQFSFGRKQTDVRATRVTP